MTGSSRPEDAVARAHAQDGRQVRLEWGPTGGAAISADADIVVVVDVLSFTTTLTIATARGTRVHPFAWKDDRAAAAYARERDAVVAVGRFEARALGGSDGRGGRGGSGGALPSLSPAQLLDAVPVPRLVLPSPNGSAICAALRAARPGLTVAGASLRNRSAVARWLAPQVAAGARVALVPAGERWPDGSLRPAVEDLWGAGAVLDALGSETPSLGTEARHARAAYRAVAGTESGTGTGTGTGTLEAALLDCASGRELVGVGFRADVVVAAALDADDVVPVLGADGFAPA
ncbi:2-phosphosulfolactate phosphatase [Pimelobacter simplex]|uniref:2-phosphosulfolactate phosphatase n=1 Tax=Nocardioides simplex TaxID=2045 RepID=UPI003AAAA2D6